MSTTSSTSPAPASPPITSTAHIHAHQQQQQNHHPPPPSSSSYGEDEDHHHHPRLSPPSTSSPPQHHIHPTLPSPETERGIASARGAIVASISNLVDTELQSRAAMLHDNAAALDKQERSVVAATAGLRRERERLAREADVAARRIKELGNVQNWAEVLERQFLVLEETVRLANGSSDDADSNCSCSCSECGGPASECGVAASGQGRDHGGGVDEGAADPSGGGSKGDDDGSAKEQSISVADLSLSDASRSLNEPESGTGTSSTKSPDTASTTTSI